MPNMVSNVCSGKSLPLGKVPTTYHLHAGICWYNGTSFEWRYPGTSITEREYILAFYYSLRIIYLFTFKIFTDMPSVDIVKKNTTSIETVICFVKSKNELPMV